MTQLYGEWKTSRQWRISGFEPRTLGYVQSKWGTIEPFDTNNRIKLQFFYLKWIVSSTIVSFVVPMFGFSLPIYLFPIQTVVGFRFAMYVYIRQWRRSMYFCWLVVWNNSLSIFVCLSSISKRHIMSHDNSENAKKLVYMNRPTYKAVC
jgi:hypothetical protein